MVQRDEKGRFKKGASGNPGGRPIDQSKYLKKIDTALTFKSWRAIIKKAIEQAERGDSKARQWLSDYVLGKPTQNVNQKLEHMGVVDVVFGEPIPKRIQDED